MTDSEKYDLLYIGTKNLDISFIICLGLTQNCPMESKNLLSIQDAAKLLNVSTKTLRRWEKSGKLVPQRTDGNHRRYPKTQIDEFIRNANKAKKVSSPMPEATGLDITGAAAASKVAKKTTEKTPAVSSNAIIPESHIKRSKRNILLTSGIASMIMLLLLTVIVSASGFFHDGNEAKLALVKNSSQDVLGLSIGDAKFIFRVNVPASFSQNVEFLNGIDVTGVATTSGGIITNNSDVDAGTGSVFASNLIYGLVAGSGITISAGQTPTITSNGVVSLGGQTGDVSLVAGEGISISGTTISNTNVYTAGTGISISDGTISSTVTGSTEDTFKNILIGSDTITATSADDELEFIAGTNVTLTADTTNKTITIDASGTGTIGGSGTASRIPRFSGATTLTNSSINDLYGGGVALTIDASGRLGVGTTTPTSTLDIAGTASVSGALSLYGTPQIQSTAGQTLTLGGDTTGNIVLSPLNGSGTIQLTNLTTNGGILYTNGSGVVAQTTTGGLGQCLVSNGDGTHTWGSCGAGGGGGAFSIAGTGVIYPQNTTTDLLLGATSTDSAKFAFLNVLSGTPTASISANSGDNALYITGDGTLGTTNAQTLTIGSATTGDIVLSGFGAGIIHSDANGVLSSSAVDLGSSDVTGTLGVGSGGTGVSTFGGTNTILYTTAADTLASLSTANNAALITNATGVPSFTTAGTNQVLRSDGTGAIAFGAIDLSQSNSVTNTLGVANGGTGADLTSGGLNNQGRIPFFNGSGVLTTLAPSTAGYVLTTGGAGADPSWTNPASLGTNYWQINSGLLSPFSNSLDFALGGTATTGAKFAITNVLGARGNQTATLSGSLVLDSVGSLTTTNNQTLTIGGGQTGNLVLDGGAGIVRVADLTTNGVVYTSNTNGTLNTEAQLSVPRGGTGVSTFGGTNTILYTTAADTLASLSTANNAALITNATGVPSFTTAGTNQVLRSDGTGAIAFGAIDLSQSNSVTNTLGVTNGGTGVTTFGGTNTLLYTSSADTLTSLALGSDNQCLTVQSSSLAWQDCSAVSGDDWNVNQGAIFPQLANTLDLLIGGASTTSAKFAVLGTSLSRGLQTATLSGSLVLDAQGSLTTTNNQTLTLGGGSTGNIVIDSGSGLISLLDATDITGTLTSSGLITADGGLTVTSGQTTTLASFTTNGGLLYTNGSGVVAQTTAGNLGECLISNGGGSPSWGSCTGAAGESTWNIVNGAISPKISSVDLLLGATSTDSAKFAFLNVLSGTPTASISANSGDNALYITGDGTLGTTNAQTLTIGSATTGDIVLSGFGAGIIHSDANGVLSSSAVDLGSSDVTGTLGVGSGGTGVSTFGGTNTILYTTAADTLASLSTANNAALITNATGVPSFTTAGTNQVLRSDGTGAIAFGAIDLSQSNSVTNTLGVTNGGTGVTTFGGTNTLLYTSSADTLTSLALGSDNQCLTVQSSSLAWQDCSAVSGDDWNVNQGAIFPQLANTLDLLIGGASTTSAKFAVLGTSLSRGLQTATLSGSLVLDAQGSLTTTNNQTLTIGGGQTGNVVIDSGNGVVRLPDLAGDRAVFTNSNSTLVTTAASSALINTLSDETGSGVAVFGTSPEITTSLTTASTNFDLINTAATTINFAGAASTLNVGAAAGTLNLGSGGNYSIATTTDGDLTIDPNGSGDLNLNTTGTGNLSLGNASSTITISSFTTNGGLLYTNGSGVVAQTTAGNLGECLISNGGGSPSWGSCIGSGGTNWDISNGIITPKLTSTLDFLLGGTSTTSAKFAVTGINNARGNQVATLSGSLVLDSVGSLTTTNNQTLTIGGGQTGNVVIDSGNGVVRLPDLAGDRAVFTNSNSTLVTTAASSALINTLSDETGSGVAVFGTSPEITTSLTTASTNFDLINTAATTINFAGAASTLNVGAAAGTLNLGSGGNYSIATTTDGDLTIDPNGSGDLNLNTTGTGNLSLGNASSTITISSFTTNGGLLYTNGSGVVAQTTAGNLGECLISNGGGSPSWGSCIGSGGTNWDISNGIITPKLTSTLDFLLGGTSTTSAKFAVTGINNARGNQVATLSGSLVLDSVGSLTTTNNQTLTIGGGQTGNVVIDSGNGVVRLPDLAGDRAVFTNSNSTLVTTAASSALINTLSDETGSGVAVFGTSPEITTSLTTASTNFDLINTAATTINFAGAASTLNVGAAAGTLNLGSGGNYSIATTTDGDLTIDPNGSGDLNLNTTGTGNLSLGNASSTITISSFTTNGGLLYTNGSGVVAQTTAGNLGECLISNGGGSPSWGSCIGSGGTNWDISNGIITPKLTSTLDFLLGGTSTTSAKFAVTGINNARGNQVATLSGSLVLDSVGSLTTTNNQTLTIGGGQTGNLVLDGGAGIVRVADLTTNGVVYTSNTNGTLNTEAQLSVPRGGTGVSTFGGTNTILYTTAADTLASLSTANNAALITNATGVPSFTTAGTNQVLRSDGTGAIAFGAIDLSQSNSVTNTLGVTNGGTGVTTFGGTNTLLYTSSADTLTSLALGSDNQCLTVQSSSLAWQDCSAVSGDDWNVNQGAIFPQLANTLDLLIGGASTTSAKFAVLGTSLSRGLQTATLSGSLVLDAQGSLTTTNNQTLTIGGGQTGNLVLDGGAGIVRVADLTTNGVVYTSNTNGTLNTEAQLSVPRGGTGVSTFGGTNTILYTTAADTLASLSTANNAALITNATGVPSFTTAGTNQVLRSDGTGAIAFGAIDLSQSNSVTNTLGVTNGGTGVTTFGGTNTLLYTSSADTLTSLALGSDNQCLTVQSSSLAWQDCSAVSGDDWNVNQGAIFPQLANTLDLLIGGASTTSAKFAVLGTSLSRGLQTATLSGSLVLDAQGSLTTTNNQTLTIGGGQTGNLVLDGGAGIVRVADLTTNGVVYTSNTNGTLNTEAQLSVPRGGTGVSTFGGTNTILYTTAADTLASLSTANNAALITNATGVPSFTTAGTNQVLRSDGTGAIAFGAIDLSQSNSVTNTLGVTNGGTGVTTIAAGSILAANSLDTLSAITSTSGDKVLRNNGGTISWADSATLGTNYWQINQGLLSPYSDTLDFALGATSTTSAKFAVTNILTGTPVATLSAGAAGGAYITADGILATTNNQTLTLGGSNTGNILIDSGSDTISFTDIPTISSFSTDGGLLYTNGSGLIQQLGSTGTNLLCLIGNASGAPSWGPCSTGEGAGGFAITGNGTTVQVNTTTDLLVGGDSTQSAQFAIIGIQNDTPVATLAAGTNNGLVLDADGSSIQSLQNQTLTLGGDTSGNIILAPLSGISGAYVAPNTDNQVDLGQSSLRFRNLYIGSDVFVNGQSVCLENGTNCPTGSVSYWDLDSGALLPTFATTVDFLLGGNSTESANFAVLGINDNLPVATLAAGTGNGLVLNANNASIQSLQNQSLTLGGGDTGNIVLSGFGAGIVKSDAAGVLSSSAVDLSSSDVTNTLGVTNGGTGVTTFGGTNTLLYTSSADTLTSLALGSDNQCLTVQSSSLAWQDCSAVSGDDWNVNQGAIFPQLANTLDLLIGGASTTSAKFAVLGTSLSRGLQTATLSGSLVLDAQGSLTTTNNQTLTIGGGQTGNLVLDGGAGIVRVADLTTNGVVYTSNTNGTLNTEAQLSVPRGGTGVSTFGGTNTILYTTAADTLASLSTANNAALITNATGVPSFTTAGTNQVLRSDGTGAIAFGAIDLSQSNSVTNTLGVTNGGTGVTTFGGTNTLLYTSSADTLTSLALGSDNQCLTVQSSSLAWQDCSAVSGDDWNVNQGAIFPQLANTLDLLIGGASTTSAKFAVLGTSLSRGLQTATLSGSLVLDAQGSLTTTNNQTLTIGGGQTGNLVLDGGAGIVRVADLTTNGVVYTSNTNGTLNTEAQLSVPRGGTGVSTFGGTNTILYTTAADTLASLSTANNAALITNATGVPSFTTAGTNQVLRSDGTGAIAFGAIDLSQSNSVTNTLGVTNGGTGVTTFGGTNTLLYTSSADTLTSLALGSDNQCLTVQSSSLAWQDCSAVSGDDWNVNQGAIFPQLANTLDLLIGGASTTSAKFAVLGTSLSRGLQTATLSGSLVLDAQGSLTTTNNQTLTIGGGQTGNLVLDGGAGIVRVADLTTNGVVYTSNTNGTLNTEAQLSVPRGGTGVSTFGGTNTILYTTAADTLASLSTANNAALITNATGVPSFTTAGTNQVLRSDGTGAIAFGAIDLSQSNSVTNTLGVTNGGTGVTTFGGTNTLLYTSSADTLTSLALGSDNQCLTVQSSSLAWQDCSAVSGDDWNVNQGAIFPQLANTLDLLIGGASTTSAKFAVLGTSLSRGLQTATLSGSLVLDAQGSLTTTNNQTLTIGGGQTGNLVLDGGAGIVRVADLTTNGVVYTSNTNGTLNTEAQLSVPRGGTGVSTFGGTNTILYTTAADTLASLSTANNAALITNATGVPSFTTAGTNQVLRSDGTGAIAFGAIDLSQSNSVTNTLGVTNGGTGVTTFGGTNTLLYTSSADTLTSLALGSDNQCLTVQSSSLAWQDCSAVSGDDWNVNQGAIFPQLANTLDLLIGGASTTSAKFAVLGTSLSRGLQTATLSGSLVLDAQGSLTTTNNQTLTIGGGQTGNLVLDGGAGIVRVADLTTNGVVYTSNTNGTLNTEAQLSVPRGGTGVSTFGGTNTILYTTAADTLASLSTANNAALITNATGVPSFTTAGTNQVLRSDGTGAIAFGAIDLSQSNSVTNTLGVTNGGTGVTTFGGTNTLLYTSSADTLTSLALGSDNQCLTVQSSSLAWQDCSAVSGDDWNVNQGAIFPQLANTLDLLIGGASTTSAKFAVLGTSLSRGLQTATLSGSLVLDAQGSLTTTNNQTLTIGGGQTGDIVLGGFGAGALTTDSNGKISTGTLSVGNGGTGLSTIAAGSILAANSLDTLSAITSTSGDKVLRNNAGTISWADSATLGTNYWQINQGLLSPYSDTLDLALGGTSTTSAKFTVTGINGTATPVASVSAQNALGQVWFFSADGTIQTSRRNTLTLGSGSTGNVVIDAGTNITQLADATIQLTGEATTISTTTTNTGITLNTNGIGALTLDNGTGAKTISIGTGGTGIKTINIGTGAANNIISLGGTSANTINIGNGNTTTGLTNTINIGAGTPAGTGLTNITIGNSINGGALNLRSGSGNITLGANVGNGNIVVAPNAGGKSALIIDKLGSAGDIFTASASGTTVFSLTNTGGIWTSGSSGIGSGTQCLTGGSTPTWQDCGAASGIISYWDLNEGALSPTYASVADLLVGGTSTTSAQFAITGIFADTPVATLAASTGNGLVLNADGSSIQSLQKRTLALGGGDSGDITLTPNGATGLVNVLTGNLKVGNGSPTNALNGEDAYIEGGLEADGAVRFDSSSITFGDAGFANCSVLSTSSNVVTCSGGASLGTNYWQLNGAVLSQGNLTTDLTLGGTSTTSAKFAFINAGSTSTGTPVASISAGVTGATYLTADGTLATTNLQPLNIGGQTTGNIIFDLPGFVQPIPIASTSTILNTDSKSIVDAINELLVILGGGGTGGLWKLSANVISPNSVSHNFGIGASSSPYPFYYDSGNQLLTLTNTTAGNSFVVNDVSSDTSPFVIDTNGNVGIQQSAPRAALDVAGDASTSASLVFTGSSASVDVLNGYDLNFATSRGGDAGLTTRLTLTSQGNLVPGATDTYSIGTDQTDQFSAIYGQTLYQNGSQVCDTSGNCSGVSMGLWSLGTGTISTVYPSVDVLLGSTATSSSKFAFTGVAGAVTPVATISAQNALGQALVLSGDGSIQATRNNTLTLGGSSTGNIYAADNLLIGATTPTISAAGFTLSGNDAFVADALGVEGTIYTDSGLNINNATFAIDNAGAITGTVDINSTSVSISDDNISFDSGTGTTFTTTGDLTLSAGGGNILSSSPINIGGATQQSYNFFAADTSGNSLADSASDLYIQDELEVDGNVSLGGATITLANGTFANCSVLTTTSNVLGCGTGSGFSNWDVSTANGTITPKLSSTLDFLLGGTGTPSAKFAVTGVNGTKVRHSSSI